ncbi:enoyl-CoA hydratase/isomerase family protein [Natronoglycomyces albus]|uniref:Enoyl-CoA hydratase/isomerase family protein n=1 Tax=Natronoglycomyces albus TaxID=2811108 RepID=A0A895XY91_9ACTN|nr:enoyl-CoA hydratase/isomerase family protein [Natronoglycomyces albus]QSB06588.1 enoyl-CoA hydratase/isomerase family protein [Natronoglycomyces albus]
MTDSVHVETTESTAHIWLRPSKGGTHVTTDALRLLRNVGRNLTGNIRSVTISGRDDDFCSGFDPDAVTAADLVSIWRSATSWLRRPDLLSIALLHGRVEGVGFNLALECDLRVADPETTFTAGDETLVGQPWLPGLSRLVELVGQGRVMEITQPGRHRFDAYAAHAWGLVNVLEPSRDGRLGVAARWARSRQTYLGTGIEVKSLLRGNAHTFVEDQEDEAQTRILRELFGDTN